ncbi:hypothetical protein D918_07854 [Trichuris suis]|nr:hypothetical protein D918_07854 [Trichuris suis]
MTIGNPRYNAASTATTTGSTLHGTQSSGDHATGQPESTRPLKRSGSKQRFEIVRKLGSGTYGKVSLAIDHRTGEQSTRRPFTFYYEHICFAKRPMDELLSRARIGTDTDFRLSSNTPKKKSTISHQCGRDAPHCI